MPLHIYTKNEEGVLAKRDIKPTKVKLTCRNPWERGFRLVHLSECDTEKEDCLDLCSLHTIHHEATIYTEDEVFVAVYFTNQNSKESAYLCLSDTFPFAYVNYEEHKIWCAEFNEPAPTFAEYIMEVFTGSKDKPAVNAFVQNPNGTVEFFNGIAATEATENRVNEFTSLEDIAQARQAANDLAAEGDYEAAIDQMIQVVEAQEVLYNEINPDWKNENDNTAKLLKKYNKSVSDWNDALDDRQEGDFEDSFKMMAAQSDLLAAIFEANTTAENEEE